jgi:DNA-binding response OmpR family regulator
MTSRSRLGEGGERAVLIVEDDPSIAKLLDTYLARADFEPVVRATGEDALATFPERTWSAVILDLSLPGLVDGMDVCRSLRSRSDVPIIMLSARDQELDRVLGLEIGADDYVTKPFSPRELVARLKAILRRASAQAGGAVLTHGQITWDQTRHLALLAGNPVPLTNREFDLLGFLIANRGLALTRRQLLDGVWGPEWYGDDRTVDVHIRQLRRKFGDALQVATLWGVGYRLD